ncbi:inverse autotransporter beta domain-containing protein [Blochmannia endosymbiont of Camponotus sp.]|uniref:inverse autotransporter beta domain-containing protein n=1 Tax=Blochmannia endosymbiont of Camponotus sp. TaxID=700220 RepID=UPI002025654F|nr:inverse autotransporter beta domain-containing protein [Blochmannia endosymbiont of Camponotus sp.]URJ30016.1 inverse autotransporter beta domain-containing protein [Blochmannia endosymbiont of Camponotus sp.]
MFIFIILGVILQALIYNEIAWCDILKNRTKFNISDSIFQIDSYQQKMKLYTYDDHKHNTLNIYPYTIHKPNVRSHYNYKSPFSSVYRSKIQLQNDSINVFHSFRVQHNIYQENLSFMQLGVHNLLSKQILNFGGGKRRLYNNKHAIGCNTLYHCPISNQSNQPCSINFGVEYWLRNTSFMLSNYYNLDNIFTSKKSLQQYDIKNPNSGYQMHIQIKFPYFLEFTGKIKLERLFYDKKYEKIFNTKNNDNCLSLDLNYKPIPILGFNINNVFMNKKYYNTICQILIDYQFGTPISEQIQYTNKNNTSLSKYLDTIIQPFIPTVIQYNNCMFLTSHSNEKSLSYAQQITGYPGEIKIIETNDHNDKSAQWNFNLLQNQGGNIIPITNNTYALYLPNHPITKEDNIFISYITNTTQNDQKQKKQNIHILVKNFSHKKPSNTQQNNISAITDNNDSGINVTENTIKHSLMNKENHRNFKDNTSIPNLIIKNDTTTEKPKNLNEIQNDFVFPAPPPPPIPVLFSEKQPTTAAMASSTPNTTLLSSSSYSIPLNKEDQTYFSRNDEYHITHDNTFPEYSDIEFNANNDLSQRLSIHKKSKFSSIGTTEHITKLENVISERKKTNFPNSDMAKIFFKLNLNQSSSSISEDGDTTDDSNDSFNTKN